jgi:hypothetical protein
MLMNEKFKLLALQAQMGTADFDAGSYYVATPDRMQRFAELIVRECAQIGEDVDGNQTTKNEILKHFGVDE